MKYLKEKERFIKVQYQVHHLSECGPEEDVHLTPRGTHWY